MPCLDWDGGQHQLFEICNNNSLHSSSNFSFLRTLFLQAMTNLHGKLPLNETLELNPRTFRIVSQDGLVSELHKNLLKILRL